MPKRHFNAVLRVDVNDVKPFQNPTKRRYLVISLIRNPCQDFLKQYNRWLIQTFLLLTLFQQFTTGSGWLRAYQNDYVIDNYVKPAVI